MRNIYKILAGMLLTVSLFGCQKPDYSISISTDIAESSIVITKNTPVTINYTVNSPTGVVSVIVESSDNIATRKIAQDSANGIVTASLKSQGENSYVRIVADNGTNKAEYKLSLEMETLTIDGKPEIEVAAAGGTVSLKIKSNVEYLVEIPEEAKSWISTEEPTKTIAPHSVNINVSANEDVTRKASVTVRSKSSAEIKTVFNITQTGILNNLRITCGKSSVTAPVLLGTSPSGMIFWGDGFSTEWMNGALHSYTDGVKDHIMEIHTKSTGFEFTKLTGVSRIDLIDF